MELKTLEFHFNWYFFSCVCLQETVLSGQSCLCVSLSISLSLCFSICLSVSIYLCFSLWLAEKRQGYQSMASLTYRGKVCKASLERIIAFLLWQYRQENRKVEGVTGSVSHSQGTWGKDRLQTGLCGLPEAISPLKLVPRHLEVMKFMI